MMTAASRWCVLFVVIIATFDASAEPYRPANAGVVLVRLKSGPGAAMTQRITEASTPDALLLAATQEMALGRANLDERHFGRAEALLLRTLPCVSRVEAELRLDDCGSRADTKLLIAYADVLQHGHDFGNAQRVLDIALIQDPSNLQARLMRASIRLARGEPREALGDCAKLVATTESLVAAACIAQSISLSGRLGEAVTLLQSTLEKNDDRDGRVAWACAILSELLERQGTYARAHDAIDRALAADPANVALQIQAIDLSLSSASRSQGDTSRVIELLARLPTAESVVLRRALLAQQVASSDASSLRDQWRALVAAQLKLGISAHERDRAIGELQLMKRPGEALRFALANWDKSREIGDARILVLAAQAAGQPTAAAPALEWIDSLHVEDMVIAAARVERTP
jgi:tetratricopeptide (TPR) repeat protein